MTLRGDGRGPRIPDDMMIRPVGGSTLSPEKQVIADKAARMYQEKMLDHAMQREKDVKSRKKTPGEAAADYHKISKQVIEGIERVLHLRTEGLKMEVQRGQLIVRKLEPHEQFRERVVTTTATTPPPSGGPPRWFGGGRRVMFSDMPIIKDPNSRVLSPAVLEAQQAVGHFMNNPPMHRAHPQYKHGMDILEGIRRLESLAKSNMDMRALRDLESSMAKVVEGKVLPRDADELRKQQEERWRKVK